jgi:DNA-binding phage protein
MEVQDLIERAGGEAKLAALCGVSRTTVYDWLRSNSLPGHRVEAISKGLGIPADTLLALVRVPAPRRQEAV